MRVSSTLSGSAAQRRLGDGEIETAIERGDETGGGSRDQEER